MDNAGNGRVGIVLYSSVVQRYRVMWCDCSVVLYSVVQ